MEAIIPIVIVIVLGLMIYGFIAAAKRRKELFAWATRRGLHYETGRNRAFGGQFPSFKCLNQGHSRYAHNVMTGQWAGMPITAFDYHYKTGSGKNESTHTFSAVIICDGTILNAPPTPRSSRYIFVRNRLSCGIS